MTPAERIRALRTEMAKEKIDIYLVPTADHHASEYVGAHFKCREYLTGFTGSAGTAVFTAAEAGLWTDGRYYIQAEQELKGSGVTLFRAGTEGTPSVREYIKDNVYPGCTLAFDGRCVSAKTAKEYQTLLREAGGELRMDPDLTDRIWEDRPACPKAPVWMMDPSCCGETAASKVARIREKMAEEHADLHIISTLCDICWVLNIRGGDIQHVPVPLAFLFLTSQTADLFINEDVIGDDIRRYLTASGVRIFAYETVYEAAASVPRDMKVLLDCRTVNARLESVLHPEIKRIDRPNPSERMRAVKNETEISCTKQAHIRDGVVMTKFIYWLKTNIGREMPDEFTVGKRLDEMRKSQEGFLDLSFDTICAYGANAAMMHYQARPATAAQIRPEGMLLVDSGGHYLDGTTDITRTIVLGDITSEQKDAYTRVLIGNLRLANARFLSGCTGMSLDILAREKLWEAGIDYRSGTGHGVGHILNVHEGPNAFRWKSLTPPGKADVLEPGMITTDEPGVYVDGEYGIRIENELLCVEADNNEYGQFLAFEPLTFCPIDKEGIDPSLMSEDDIRNLNAYHEQVYRVISPYLEKEEKDWLFECTRPLS